DRLSGGPDALLVLAGEMAHRRVRVRSDGDVGATQPHAPSRAAVVDTFWLEHVDASVGRGELTADVARRVDVDHAVVAAFGAEHGEVAAAVLDHFGVDS